MKLKKPLFWDLPKPNVFSYLLIPFTFPIIIKNFINKFFKKKKLLNIKTICVGNIYLGGTGKTPLTIKLYKILRGLNKKVSTVKKNYPKQKDEQLILMQKTSLIIVKDRKNAIPEGLNRKCEYLIFDDGLQDPSIDYNLKFLCFKAKNWIGNGQIIPAGPLREKISSIKKFDAVFLNGFSKNIKKIKNQIKSINSNIKIFRTFYKILNLKKYEKKSKYLIFSGIGNPDDFKDILTENGFNIGQELIFPDHYNYTQNDFNYILNNAKKNKFKILTTEKDFMKVPNNLKKKINFLSIELIIQNEKSLIKLLKN